MDEEMRKLPRYMFQRANGSYRYKRNVPKDLRDVIPKATVYRQLGNSYDDAIRALPRVHAEIEALLDRERSIPHSQRALSLVRETLGDWHAAAFQDGDVQPEYDIHDDYVALAERVRGSVPEDVVRQLGSARMSPEPMTLQRCLEEYSAYKCSEGADDRALRTRLDRLRKSLVLCLGKNRFEHTPLAKVTRADANALRDHLLAQMAPNSVLRNIGIIKAAVNHAILEHDLPCRNVFQALKIKGAGSHKLDRLPISEDDLRCLRAQVRDTPVAAALVMLLAETGARLGEVVGLEAQDVDLEAAVLHFRPNDLRRLKTRNATRSLPLSQRAKECLAGLRLGLTDTAPIFPQYARPRGSDAASAMLMKRLRTVTSDPKVTIHSLRHRMKDKLRNTGCPEALSLAILGHSTNTVAANYGAGYATEVMRDALQKVWVE